MGEIKVYWTNGAARNFAGNRDPLDRIDESIKRNNKIAESVFYVFYSGKRYCSSAEIGNTLRFGHAAESTLQAARGVGAGYNTVVIARGATTAVRQGGIGKNG